MDIGSLGEGQEDGGQWGRDEFAPREAMLLKASTLWKPRPPVGPSCPSLQLQSPVGWAQMLSAGPGHVCTCHTRVSPIVTRTVGPETNVQAG